MRDYIIGFMVGYSALIVAFVICRRVNAWMKRRAEHRAAEIAAKIAAEPARSAELRERYEAMLGADSYCDLERMIEERTKVNPRFPEMLAEAVKRREEEREIDGIVFKPGKPLNPVPTDEPKDGES